MGKPPRAAKGRIALGLAVLVGLLTLTPALAVGPNEVLKDPALERRARELSAGLRCLVCQNQSIDESDAPLAKDLRTLVRDRIQAGDADDQVRDYVVQRYGEFVLLKPVFGAHTVLLWLTPMVVLSLGAFGLYRSLRRRPGTVEALATEEQAALDSLLRQDRAAS
jgi:cytochrome c-type biogenesis protein CcmH